MKQWLIAILIILIATAGAAALYFYLSQPEVNQRQSKPRSVNVIQPQMQTVRDTMLAVGTLQARDDVVVTSEVTGRVVKLNFNSGDAVSKGQLLVQLDDRQMQANLNVTEAQLQEAQRQLNRATQLRASNSISQSQVDELQTAVNVAQAELRAVRVRLENHRIEAPFDGHVGLLDLSVGAYLENGDQITTLDATATMELTFSVPERFIGQLHIDQTVLGTSAAYPDTQFTGKLAELGIRVDPLSRTLPVRALVDNTDGRLRPGMYMSVSLVLQQREALVVPEQGVLVRGSDHYLFVARDGIAERRNVQLGVRDKGTVEILEGVSVDDQVVITAQDRLSSGDAIQVQSGGDPIPTIGDSRETKATDTLIRDTSE